MKVSQQSQSCIETALQEAVARYKCACEQTIVTDIHLLPDQPSGQLTIYDDDDNELASTMVKEWVTYEDDDFAQSVQHPLRNVLRRMKDAGDFDKITILKPYSFVLVDDEKETIAELLLMDDDTLLVDKELLKGLDKELDDFLKELLTK
ncbi:MAG: hypothetical protein LBN29_14545 [Mediterranea sp.]|jgi:hypothetical protein|nr:hypothetical protein [Mediterranea sp.]